MLTIVRTYGTFRAIWQYLLSEATLHEKADCEDGVCDQLQSRQDVSYVAVAEVYIDSAGRVCREVSTLWQEKIYNIYATKSECRSDLLRREAVECQSLKHVQAPDPRGDGQGCGTAGATKSLHQWR